MEASELPAGCLIALNPIVGMWNEVGCGVGIDEGKVIVVEDVEHEIVGNDVVGLTASWHCNSISADVIPNAIIYLKVVRPFNDQHAWRSVVNGDGL